jgi:hypothetical protein
VWRVSPLPPFPSPVAAVSPLLCFALLCFALLCFALLCVFVPSRSVMVVPIGRVRTRIQELLQYFSVEYVKAYKT